MSDRELSKMVYMKYVAMFLLLSVIAVPVNARSYQTEEQVRTAKEEANDVERIEVYGKKPLRFYYKEYIKAEDNFVALFNQLTLDKDFYIRCGYRKKSGATRLKGRYCEPNYKPRLIHKYRFLYDGVFAGYEDDLEQRRQDQIAHTQDLIEGSPELRKAFINYTNAHRTYQKKQQETYTK